MPRPQLALFALLAVLAAVALALWGRGAGAGGGLEGPAAEAHERAARPAPGGAATEVGGARAAAAGTAPDDSLASAPTPDEPGAPLLPLALRVLERDARRPLADFALALRQEETQLELATDALGRAVTPAVWRPGLVSIWHRPDPTRVEYRAEWRLEPWQLELRAGEAGERELVARAPALVLEALARGADGAGVAGAEVSLVYGWRDEAGGFHSEFVDPAITGADGRARFALFDEEARGSSIYLHAQQRETGIASGLVFLDPPLGPGPYALELRETASLVVRAYGRDGLPLASGQVSASFAEPVESAMGVAGARVEAGLARLARLSPAPHRVRVFEAGTGDLRSAVVALEPGREAELELRFDDGRTELAAEGVVLDEDERPLAGVNVWLRSPEAGDQVLRTGADGRFRFFAPPSSHVTVATADDLSNALFDPSAARVRFGARELCFRRARALEPASFVFEVVDGTNGLPPRDGGGVQVWVGEPRPLGGWDWAELREGRAELRLGLRPGLRYSVRCRGYVERRGELALPVDSDAPAPVRVALEPGFGWSVLALDARTGLPLEGVTLFDPDGPLRATTDARGAARLEADAWPARLRARREGYRERVLDPEDLELVAGRVELEPAR